LKLQLKKLCFIYYITKCFWSLGRRDICKYIIFG